MAQTQIRGTQVEDGTIQRRDINTVTVGQALVTKLVQGTNITLSSTGADSGTGDVTISCPTGGVGPPGAPGTQWWNGTGPPGVISGSHPGDYYLDVSNGDVYTL